MQISKFIQKTFAVSAVAVIMASCASTSSKEAYQTELKKLQSDRPEAKFVVTGDQKVDELGNASAIFYKECTCQLDNYLKKTKKYTSVMEKKKAMMDDPSVTFTKEESALYSEREKILTGMDWKQITKLSIDAANMIKKASDAKSSFKGFDKETMAKASSVSKILNQLNYSAHAMKFLLEEKSFMSAQATQ